MSKRKIFIVALSVCLIAILSLGTLAWFTAEDSVTNNFYVGDTDTEADEVFGIDLWENRDTNGDGDYNEAEDAEKAEGLTYETILPGEKLSKEPHLENTGIHPQYVRAIVTVTEADILKVAMTPKGSDVSEWFQVERFLPGTSSKWTLEYKFYTNDDTFVFVYYYNEILEADAVTEQLFDAVVIPTELTKEQAAEMDNFQINILGQAIQSEHLVDVTNAKEAFAKYWDEEGYVAGIEQNPEITVSYPMTGNYGTINEDLVTYDHTNYTDPETAGNLVIEDLTVTIKSGASLVVVPASENNATIQIWGGNFTVEDGGYIIDVEEDSAQWIYICEPVYINGVEVTNANLDEMIAKYFNFPAGHTWIMY